MALALSCVSCGAEKKEEFKLVWSDEFDYDGLPDSTKWNYEEGFVRNQEAQYFTKERTENCEVVDGVLHLRALKESFNGANYSSASVITKDKYHFTYGRIEIMAKVPEGVGVWPALWTLGTNIEEKPWPLCGEIDILEFVGHDSEHIHTNIHTKLYNHNLKTNIGMMHKVYNPWEDFHLYAVEWYPERIEWFYDDQLMFTANKKEGDGVEGWPFFEPQYLIMNLAIGGTWGGEKGIDDTIFPCEFAIDYVRIFELIQ